MQRKQITMHALLLPLWLIHTAVAAVWLYEGFWCKLLHGAPSQVQVVAAVPYCGPRFGRAFLKMLGVVEVGLGLWVLTGVAPIPCALTQTILLVSLNACGLTWARHIIHDPPGMVVKNISFLVLAWVSASFPAWS